MMSAKFLHVPRAVASVKDIKGSLLAALSRILVS